MSDTLELAVRTFRYGTDKEVARKVPEEAAEVYSAWESDQRRGTDHSLADLLRDMGAKSTVVRVWVDNRGCTMMSGRMHDGAGGHTLPTELVAVREEIE